MMKTRFSVTAIACGLALALVAGTRVHGQEATSTQKAPRLDGIRRVSQMIGAEVRGTDNQEQIADVNDLIMDGHGHIRYILIGRGGVAGAGEDVIVVPFRATTISRVENQGWAFQIDKTGEQLKAAPTLEGNRLEVLTNENWLQTNREFFGIDQATAGGEREGEGPSILIRASSLVGTEVRRPEAEESIADVEDVLLDAEYNAAYVILGYGGVADVGENLVPVPFSKVQIDLARAGDNTEDKQLRATVDMTKERLENAPHLEGEYNRLLQAEFVDRVSNFYK